MRRVSTAVPSHAAPSARALNSSDLAAELIRSAILDGTLVAGQRLKEDELATRLDVSRTPVREALRQLAAEDLVVLEPKRGARVRHYDAAELDDLYQLRAVLEGYAAGRAAERATDEQLAALRGSCRRFSRLAALKRTSPAELAAENQVFHGGVIDAAADPRLGAMIQSVIRLPLVYKAYIWFSPDQKSKSARYHEQILEAIERRDAKLASRTMSDHVYEARDELVRAIAAESH